MMNEIKELKYLFELSDDELDFYLKRNISRMRLFVWDRNSVMSDFFELYYENEVLNLIINLKYLDPLYEYMKENEIAFIKSHLLKRPWYSEADLEEYSTNLVKKYGSFTNLLDSVIFEGKEEKLQHLERVNCFRYYIYLVYKTEIAI